MQVIANRKAVPANGLSTAEWNERRAAVATSARLGGKRNTIQRVARRNGVSYQMIFSMLGEALDIEHERGVRFGYRQGRAAGMPNLPKMAVAA